MAAIIEKEVVKIEKTLNIGEYLIVCPTVRIVGIRKASTSPTRKHRGQLVQIAFGPNADMDEQDIDRQVMNFSADELELLAEEFQAIANYLKEINDNS